MSKAATKVELEEQKSNKIGFENAPKLFSKWAYDEIKVIHSLPRLKILASLTISLPNPLKPKSSSPTLQEDIKPKSSEKPSALSLKD